MIIDAHVHLQGSVFRGDHNRSGPAQLLAALDEAGIQKAVVQSLSAGDDNGCLLTDCALHPDRLTPFVLEYPDSPGLQNISKYIAAGARGIGEIYVRPGSKDTLTSYLAPLITVARTNRLPIFFHTGDFSYTAPILAAEVIHSNPDINFILGHMGSLYYVLDTIEILKAYPNAYADTSGMTSPLMLGRAMAECGAEKLLFGSDYPFWNPQVELRRIYVARLGQDAERKILSENAVKLFKM
jgi:uncharacterized protein